MNSSGLQTGISHAYQLFKGGQIDASLKQIKRLLAHFPNQFDLVHLAALAYRKSGNVVESQRYFDMALSVSADDAQLNNNFANFLKEQKNYSLAIEHYKKSLKAMPTLYAAQKNLALCYAAQGGHHQAITYYQALVEAGHRDAGLYTALANSYRAIEQFSDARMSYEKALSLEPNYENAIYNSGLNFQLQNELDKAERCYAKAAEINPKLWQAYEGLAATYIASGKNKEAITALKAGIKQVPVNTQLHRRLNDLLWADKSSEFGDSYRSVLSQHDDDRLLGACIDQLIHADCIQQAELTLQAFSPSSGVGVMTTLAQAKLLAINGDLQSANQTVTHALSSGFQRELAMEKLKLGLLLCDYTHLESLIQTLLTQKPDCQTTWAYQALLWKMTGNEKYHWLCDYSNLLQVIELKTPEGYSSKQEFFHNVESYLLSQHQDSNTPLEQTLRHGTQTAPRILNIDNPLMKAVKASLEVAIKTYIDNLPKDNDHPFLNRISESFSFSGSWSVKLKPNGYHINHVHPEGWISSSCYIALPESVKEGGNQGNIVFGQSPFQLGGADTPDRTIVPKLGTVVLFPSFFWHGTTPFSGDDLTYRLTLPFDVCPLSSG